MVITPLQILEDTVSSKETKLARKKARENNKGHKKGMSDEQWKKATANDGGISDALDEMSWDEIEKSLSESLDDLEESLREDYRAVGMSEALIEDKIKKSRISKIAI